MEGERSLPVTVRDATEADLEAVIALDAATSGSAKPAYWREIFERHRERGGQSHFLVAELDGRFAGFIVGEVRAWEFGSPPCGWVFALNVVPALREGGVGSRLFRALCERLRATGVRTVRTMVSRRDRTNLSFFRSQGLTTGPYIELERALD